MKTIILCGGKGTRLREETEFRPKPMVTIGGIPVLVHIMNIYAHYGYNEFILCLGYKSNIVKDYFFNISRYSDDVEFDMETCEIKHLKRRSNTNYKILFAETGEDTLTSERIKMVMPYVKEDQFMVTYGDGVSTVNISKLVDFHNIQTKKHGSLGTLSAVHPSSKYGKLTANKSNIVKTFSEKPMLNDFINGGFMIFNKNAKKYFKEDEMLEDSLATMSSHRKLSQFLHEGFWHSMDTMKDVMDLNKLWEAEHTWAVWEKDKHAKS